jgi:hypothetical protein
MQWNFSVTHDFGAAQQASGIGIKRQGPSAEIR